MAGKVRRVVTCGLKRVVIGGWGEILDVGRGAEVEDNVGVILVGDGEGGGGWVGASPEGRGGTKDEVSKT